MYILKLLSTCPILILCPMCFHWKETFLSCICIKLIYLKVFKKIFRYILFIFFITFFYKPVAKWHIKHIFMLPVPIQSNKRGTLFKSVHYLKQKQLLQFRKKMMVLPFLLWGQCWMLWQLCKLEMHIDISYKSDLLQGFLV